MTIVVRACMCCVCREVGHVCVECVRGMGMW